MPIIIHNPINTSRFKSPQCFTKSAFDKNFNANANSTTTIGTNVSATVIGTQINLRATTVNTLFGSNSAISTTITIVGLDSGARITIPVTITKTT